MNRLEMKPDGFACTLAECPPGFFLHGSEVCFKSEYNSNDGRPEVFCDSGEAFWAGTKSIDELLKLEVQPLIPMWIENE